MPFSDVFKSFWWVNHRTKLVILLILLFIALFAVFSHYGIYKRIVITAKKNSLTEEIKQSQVIIDSLRARANKLRFDTLEIEKVARESYGLIKPGEKVYYINNQGKSN